MVAVGRHILLDATAGAENLPLWMRGHVDASLEAWVLRQ
jgi:hypothetical protein